MLCTDKAQPHLRALLRRQQQCHPQKTPQHGGQNLWLSMMHHGKATVTKPLARTQTEPSSRPKLSQYLVVHPQGVVHSQNDFFVY